jgi:hypothetical protein
MPAIGSGISRGVPIIPTSSLKFNACKGVTQVTHDDDWLALRARRASSDRGPRREAIAFAARREPRTPGIVKLLLGHEVSPIEGFSNKIGTWGMVPGLNEVIERGVNFTNERIALCREELRRFG